jgi:hypothetical protein
MSRHYRTLVARPEAGVASGLIDAMEDRGKRAARSQAEIIDVMTVILLQPTIPHSLVDPSGIA